MNCCKGAAAPKKNQRLEDGVRIAVIGWGSLIWNQAELQISKPFTLGGPALNIEFARISMDGRLTLIVDDGFQSNCFKYHCSV